MAVIQFTKPYYISSHKLVSEYNLLLNTLYSLYDGTLGSLNATQYLADKMLDIVDVLRQRKDKYQTMLSGHLVLVLQEETSVVTRLKRS